MPKSVHFTKNRLGRMEINDAASQAAWDELPADRLCRADIVVPRNLKHHRQFFALLHVIFEAQDFFPTIENLRAQVLIGCGFYQKMHRFDGSYYYVADSMAFDKMGDDAFNPFFDKFVKLCDEKILPNVGEQTIRDMFEEILQGNSDKLGKRRPASNAA